MVDPTLALRTLSQEARAMAARLARVKPFALHETMVPAAALSSRAQAAIERFLLDGRGALRQQIGRYLDWLESPDASRAEVSDAHRKLIFLRLRFNSVLSQFDIFSEAMSQRSESETGVWLRGLDVASEDALELPGHLRPPAVVCYLARGPGAAIRRARTRLPGGGENPVALLRLPRERMVGSGIASSLVHEVGHQGAALLGLVPSLRAAIGHTTRRAGTEELIWRTWGRWISEIVADLWSVSKVGVTSTAGLMGVVGLPRAFVFRPNTDDPHPTPWLRVKLSAALGHALYPHPQWRHLAELWEAFYPVEGLAVARAEHLRAMEASLPELVELLVEHRPRALRGATLSEAMETVGRQPKRLLELFQAWRRTPAQWRAAPPSLAFAVVGQARVDGALSPEDESELVADLLRHWALTTSIEERERCAACLDSHHLTSGASSRPHALPTSN